MPTLRTEYTLTLTHPEFLALKSLLDDIGTDTNIGVSEESQARIVALWEVFRLEPDRKE